ncbi:MAG: tetratricopeptide repeat protein [Chloroflexi bacterium]|nr:tetratricopeptide repeat protein [Chloroflexota bacterium]
MRTKLGAYCDRLIEAGWLAAAAVIPFFFDVYSSRVFEPDKLTMLRSIALIMAVAFIIKTIEALPADRSFSSWFRGFAKATPVTAPVLIYLAISLLTTFTSVVPSVSFWGSYQRLQGTLVALSYLTVFFLTAHHLRTRAQLSRLLWVVVLDATVISLYGLVQHYRLDPLPWGGDVIARVTSTMGNAIFLAAYLIMAVPLALALLISNIATLTSPVQPTAGTANDGGRLFPRLISVLSALVAGVGFFGLVLRIIQYVSFRRGLADFGTADWLWLAIGALAVLAGLALVILRPASLRQIRRYPLAFFLAASLTAMLAIQLQAIVFSESRGPWFGIAVGLAAFAYLYLIRRKRYRLAIVATALFVMVAAFVVLLNTPDSPVARMKSLSPRLARLGSLSDMDSGTSKVRLLIWFGDDVGKGALGLIKSNPVRTLIGYGPESMYVAYNPFYPPSLANIEARNASPDRSHNDLLDYLVTMGVLGLVSYGAVVVAFFGLAGRLIWRLQDGYLQLVLMAFIAAIAAHLGETLFGIAIAATRTHFWLYLGAAAAIYIMSRPKEALAENGPTVAARAVAVEVRGAGAARGTGKATRAKTRRRPPTPAVQASAMAKGSLPGWLSIIPLLFYLAITLVAVLSMLLSNWVQLQEPSTIVLFGFIWFLVGLICTAFWVKRDIRPTTFCRTSRVWLYALVVLCAVVIIPTFFLNSVTADIYFKKGQAYDGIGRFDTGIHQYLTAIRRARNQDFYYLFLGRGYLELARRAPDQKPTQDIESVDDLLRLDARNILPSTREDLFNASLVALKTAKELNPLNTDNSANLGRLYRFWGEATPDANRRQEKVDTSLKYYADALDLSPNAAHLYDEWGLVYAIQGKWEEAFVKYEKALSLDKKYVTTYVYMGEGYLNQNKLDKAEEMFRQAVERDPNLVNVHSSLGVIYYRQGKVQQAIEENLKTIQLAPNDMVSHRNLAIIYQETRQYDKAITEAQTALSLAPQDQKANLQAMVADLQRMQGGRP